LRNALANEPAVAFQAVLQNFVLATFYRFASSSGCLEIAIRTPTFPAQAPGLKKSASAEAIDAHNHDLSVTVGEAGYLRRPGSSGSCASPELGGLSVQGDAARPRIRLTWDRKLDSRRSCCWCSWLP
jgi:hypothetical protein